MGAVSATKLGSLLGAGVIRSNNNEYLILTVQNHNHSAVGQHQMLVVYHRYDCVLWDGWDHEENILSHRRQYSKQQCWDYFTQHFYYCYFASLKLSQKVPI